MAECGKKIQHYSSSKNHVLQAAKRIPLTNNHRFSGTDATVKDNVKSAQQVAKSFECKSFEFASTTEQMDALWSARKQALWASLAVREEGTEVWSTDVAVPLSRMAELIGKPVNRACKRDNAEYGIEISKERAGKLGLFNSILGHVGDGNFHQMIMYNPNIPEQKQAVTDCVNLMVEDAIAMEGTVSVSISKLEIG